MSLLLTFFILLLSMATFDKQKVADAIGSLQGSLSVLEKGEKTEAKPPKTIEAADIQQESETPEAVNVFASLITEFNEMTKVAQGPSVELKEAEDGFIINLPESILFEPGSAEITKKEAFLFLERMALEVKKLPLSVKLKAIGHTDNRPLPPSSRYEGNWELSVARGISVTRQLIEYDVMPKRISAAGEGKHHPVSTNATEEGRAKNRRVALHFFSSKAEGGESAQSAKKSVSEG